MSWNAEDDRTQPASHHRRAEARRRGQVPRSAALSAALMLGGVVLLLKWRGPGLVSACEGWLSQSLSIRTVLRGDQLAETLSQGSAMRVVACALGILVGLWLTALVARTIQCGPLWIPAGVQPRAERVNPAAGLRRMFCGEALVEGSLWSLRLLAFAWLMWRMATHPDQPLCTLSGQSPQAMAISLGAIVTAFALQLCGLLVMLALLDYGWKWWRHERSLMMSSEELREEHRDSQRTPERRRVT